MTAPAFLLLKSLLVFAAAGLSLWALRRAAAAARHLVCLLTLTALLALPILSLSLPGWQMLPALPGQYNPQAPAPDGTEASAPAHTHVVPLVSPPSARLAPLLSLPNNIAPNPPRPFPWPLFLLSIWAVGALLALLRPLLGLWGIRQLSRLSAPITNAPVQALAAECASALRLVRLPELRQAAVPVPMTWGSSRPVILLPRNADHWPEDRQRAVLLHEIAHVRRRDWLGHRLADAACALYWFHPLVWLVARRLRAESEIACDDLVLASGIAAPDYARHLLEIARTLSPVLLVPQTAIAMAQTSQVEGRLKMILDKTQSRRTLPRRVLLAALGLSIVSLMGLAMLRPAVQAQAERQKEMQREMAAGAPGIGFQLAGITDETGIWWDASGKRLPKAPYTSNAYENLRVDPGQRRLKLAFRLSPSSAKDVSVSYVLRGTREWSSIGTWTNKVTGLDQADESRNNAGTNGCRVVSAVYPATLQDAPLICAYLSSGPWKTAASYSSAKYTVGSSATDPFVTPYSFIFSRVFEAAAGLGVTVSTDCQSDDLRLVAIDKQGNKILPRKHRR